MAPGRDSGAPAAPTRWRAIRSGLCPVCRRGRIFSGRLAMHERCPACDVRFEREPGYFIGAMYLSYAAAVLLIGAITAVLHFAILPGRPLWLTLGAAAVLFLPLVPAVYRFSRIVWIHLDRALDPGA